MLPYWLLFLYFAVGALVTTFNSRSREAAAAAGPLPGDALDATPTPHGFALAVGMIVVAIMIGLRFEVGTDWVNYLRQFEYLQRVSLAGAIGSGDPAYNALTWLADKNGVDIWLSNLVCGALFSFGLWRFAKTQANPWLALAVAVPYLIIVVGMGYTRQAVAIGLSMIGLVAVTQGSFVRFLLWVLAAALFHRSAVVLIPVVAMAYSRNRLQAIVVGGLGSIAGFYILTRAEGLEQFRQLYIKQRLDSAGTAIRLAMNLVPALIFVGLSRRFTDYIVERRIWLMFSALAIVSAIALLFVRSTTGLDRLALYIIPLQIFVLASIPRAFSRRNQMLLVILVLAYSAVVQFVWFNFASNARNWVPYTMQIPGL